MASLNICCKVKYIPYNPMILLYKQVSSHTCTEGDMHKSIRAGLFVNRKTILYKLLNKKEEQSKELNKTYCSMKRNRVKCILR